MISLTRFLICILLTATSGFASLTVAREPDTAGDHWKQFARTDLAFIHKMVIEAHPGYIDAANPSFRKWVEAGYVAALSLLPQVRDYSSALDTVRFYVTGFRDGHFWVSDNVRPDELVRFQGWAVERTRGRYVVSGVASHWPATLPPVGTRLIACDGRGPDAIIDSDIAPYIDRRDLESSRQRNAKQLGLPMVSLGKELKQCIFRTADDDLLRLDIVYRAVPFGQMAAVVNSGKVKRPHEITYDLHAGLLWIRVPTFSLDHEQYASLKRTLTALKNLHGVQQIVFDVRGNGGGDSSIGDMIFDAATGGLRYDQRALDASPEIYALWRVSPISIESARERLAFAARTYGSAAEQTAWQRRHLDELVAARTAGRSWLRQDTGQRRLTRKDVAARHGKLRRFSGRIAVLTDSACASACLDFVDEVRLVPGSLQLGATTSADSVSIDMARVALPSGNALLMPLKVWRNRLRADNQPWKPDRQFDGDLDDDDAVRRWATSVMSTH